VELAEALRYSASSLSTSAGDLEAGVYSVMATPATLNVGEAARLLVHLCGLTDDIKDLQADLARLQKDHTHGQR
jgi:hypothetical protein